MDIIFAEDQSPGYAVRTRRNASADATIALAVDFNSAGERLTKKSVVGQGKLYIPIDAKDITVKDDRVAKIVILFNEHNIKTLNIAGNGIYTMDRFHTQEEVDLFVFRLLYRVISHPNLVNKIEHIRTGGQTGFDEAGAKASRDLGIKTYVLAPKGWKFRDLTGKDISNEQLFKQRFEDNND